MKQQQFTVMKRLEADRSVNQYYEWGRRQTVIDRVQREIRGFKNGSIRSDSDVIEAAVYETSTGKRLVYWKKKPSGS